jgi:hypothetical protein
MAQRARDSEIEVQQQQTAPAAAQHDALTTAMLKMNGES